MEQYKNFWIDGHSIPGYPGSHSSTPGACVLYQRPDNSVVQSTTLDLEYFALRDKGVAELFGLELARLTVDTCYPELLRNRQASEQRYRQTKNRRP